MAAVKEEVAGRNGIIIRRKEYNNEAPGYRTYEVYQRERVGESTEKIKPIQLVSDDYRRDPYPLLETLRENYPCYRDWLANSYWITQYNDVTSIFADEANFETRPKTYFYHIEEFGKDMGNELPVLTADANCIEAFTPDVANNVASDLAAKGSGDLATEFAARFVIDLLAKRYGVPEEDVEAFGARYWRMQRGTSWEPRLNNDGIKAINELMAYFTPMVAARKNDPGEDMVSAMAELGASAGDVVRTLLEADHETLHGALANLWYLLLMHPDEFEKARSERRLMKLAYLETLRHSTPVISADRFARHEVERFG